MGRPKKNSNSNTSTISKKAALLEGQFDIITEDNAVWDMLLKRLTKMSRTYGFLPVETPLLEDLHLYENFYKDNPGPLNSLVKIPWSGKTAVLRREFLPSVMRSYYQKKVFEEHAMSKWSFSGLTVSQTDDNRASDYRFGFEIFGQFTHLTEAQLISLVWEFLQSLGFSELSLEINNIGTADSQSVYQGILHDFLAGKKYELCDDCNENLKGRVLNVFRCHNFDCQAVMSEAPTILDFLDPEESKHFTSILEALDELRLPYQLNPQTAGPEGFSKTNFVVKYKHKGEIKILGEGGYHESLMQNLCGKQHNCFGFAGSLLEIYRLLEAEKVTIERQHKNDVFLVPLGEMASKKSLRLFRDLTGEKISVYDHFGLAGVKNQLKQAEVYKAPIALIMGQKEAMDEIVILRDVKSGMQEVISYDKIVEEVKKRLGR